MAHTNFKGHPIALSGTFVQSGQLAPDFVLTKSDLSDFSLSSVKGKYVVLNIFPSLDTSICATSVRQFNKIASQLPNTIVLAISKDLPFAHGRFCTTEGIDNVVSLSDFRSSEFAQNYGLLMEEGPLKGLLARAVVVVNPDGEVVYTELVEEITTEPNYDAAIKALK